MANNPIDTNSFRHFLLIRGVEYEIIEPVNFDKSNFKCEQGNYARDTFYGNEEELLEFYQNYGSQGTTFINNDGVLVSHLPSGLDYLVQENKDNGSESDVKYILKKDGLEFTTGNFDFSTADTDNVSYFKCKVIQNTNQAKIKKREKLNVNLLSTTDLDDNIIEAIPTQKMLLKAKPLYGVSEWEHTEESTFQSRSYYTNVAPVGIPIYEIKESQLGAFSINTVKEYGVENTLANLDNQFGASPDGFNQNSGVYLEAKEDLSNIVIKLRNLDIRVQSIITNSGGSSVTSANGSAYLVVRYGLPAVSPSSLTTIIVHQKDFVFENSSIYSFPNSFDVPIDFIQKGMRVWVYLYATSTATFDTYTIAGDFFANYRVNGSMQAGKMTIEATSTGLDSVISAVRWIDLIKQNYKAIGSLPVNASKFDVGGEFYDNFCFTKNLIKQNLTKPFNIKLSDTIGSLEELNGDAQINDNEIYIGQYTDFYQNIDMGGFLVKPDIESNITKNERYLVNSFVFGYEKYEQDRNERNTIDAIHTNSEWFPQVQNSINTKEFKAPFIRDPFSIETARKAIFSVNNNSDSTDDNIFIVDVTQLPPNARRKFTRLVSWQADGGAGTTKILSDGSFTWDLLGFNVGDTIIESGVSRTVLEITPSILTLSFVGGFASGTNFLTFDYPLTGVLYTNRTNEGLVSFENLRNGDNFSNLRYSIKRNMRHWFPNLATYGKFIPTKKLKNTFFKANGLATTQFVGEPLPIKENEDILISDISEYKILNQDIFKTRVSSTFEQSLQLLNDLQNVRGFIRVQLTDGSVVKGYIKESNFTWSLDELDLELEVKNESDFLTVTYLDGILTINEVGYDEKMADVKLYNIFNDYIQFFDKNNVNLCNRIKFDKVLLNGISYTSVTDLVNAIELL
jgi:hypothetical protein